MGYNYFSLLLSTKTQTDADCLKNIPASSVETPSQIGK